MYIQLFWDAFLSMNSILFQPEPFIVHPASHLSRVQAYHITPDSIKTFRIFFYNFIHFRASFSSKNDVFSFLYL